MTATTLHVCVTCRTEPRDAPVRAGRQLLDAVRAELGSSRVLLREAECLSACARSCVATISAPGKWSYVVGEVDEAAAADLLAFAELHEAAPMGVVPKLRRPERLAAAVLGRVPPLPPVS